MSDTKPREFYVMDKKLLNNTGNLIAKITVDISDGPLIDTNAYLDMKRQRDLAQQRLEACERKLEIATEALNRIANHKMNSVDKLYLIHQCEGFKGAARQALSLLTEPKEKK